MLGRTDAGPERDSEELNRTVEEGGAIPRKRITLGEARCPLSPLGAPRDRRIAGECEAFGRKDGRLRQPA